MQKPCVPVLGARRRAFALRRRGPAHTETLGVAAAISALPGWLSIRLMGNIFSLSQPIEPAARFGVVRAR